MPYSETLNTFAKGVRVAEHGNDNPENYSFYGDWLPNRKTRLLGAYKIPARDWTQMATAAGLNGADWRSSFAQDAVAKTFFQRLYDRYQAWEMVATAWKVGEDVADSLVTAGVTVADLATNEGGKTLNQYVTTATTGFDINREGQLTPKRIGQSAPMARDDQVNLGQGFVPKQLPDKDYRMMGKRDPAVAVRTFLRRLQANVRANAPSKYQDIDEAAGRPTPKSQAEPRRAVGEGEGLGTRVEPNPNKEKLR